MMKNWKKDMIKIIMDSPYDIEETIASIIDSKYDVDIYMDELAEQINNYDEGIARELNDFLDNLVGEE